MRIFSVNNYSIPTPVLSAAPISYEKRGGVGIIDPFGRLRGYTLSPDSGRLFFTRRLFFLYGIYN